MDGSRLMLSNENKTWAAPLRFPREQFSGEMIKSNRFIRQLNTFPFPCKKGMKCRSTQRYIIAGPILYVDGTSLHQQDPCPLHYSYHLLPTLPLSLSRLSDIPPFNIIPTSTDHILLFHNSIHIR